METVLSMKALRFIDNFSNLASWLELEKPYGWERKRAEVFEGEGEKGPSSPARLPPDYPLVGADFLVSQLIETETSHNVRIHALWLTKPSTHSRYI